MCECIVAYRQKVNRKRKNTGNSMKQLWKVLKGKVRNVSFLSRPNQADVYRYNI